MYLSCIKISVQRKFLIKKSRGELPVAHPSLVSHPLFISTMEVQVRQTNDLGESAGQENAFYVKEMT